jgi:hypothetical protein
MHRSAGAALTPHRPTAFTSTVSPFPGSGDHPLMTTHSFVPHQPLRSLLTVGLLLAVFGCSGNPGAAPASKPFSGTVKTAAGKPVGNVMVHFHPTKPGFSCAAEADATGAFSSEGPPGTYAYSVRRSEKVKGKDADAAIKAVDPKYQETDLKRTVKISEGATIEIVLE